MKARQKGKQNCWFKYYFTDQYVDDQMDSVAKEFGIERKVCSSMSQIIAQYKEWVEQDKEDGITYCGVLCGSKG